VLIQRVPRLFVLVGVGMKNLEGAAFHLRELSSDHIKGDGGRGHLASGRRPSADLSTFRRPGPV
jgi:hypothetical protein